MGGNQEAIQAIVDTVMLAVKKQLGNYDTKVAERLSHIKIGSDNLLPGAVTGAAIGNNTVSTGKISDFNSSVTNQVKHADIDIAQINIGTVKSAFVAEMVGDKVYIKNLMVDDAMIGTLTLGKLILRDADGNMCTLIPDGKGGVTTAPTYIDNDDVGEMVINAGEKLVKGSVLADSIGAGAITAEKVAAGAITAGKIAAGAVEAGNISAGVITTEHLNSEVGKTIDITANSSIEGLSSQLRAASDAITIRINTLDENLQPFTKAFRFGEEGLDISATGSEMGLRLSNDRIAFRQNEQEVAYISDEKLYISNAEVTDVLKVGNYQWKRMQDGGLGLMYVGA